MTFVFQPDSDGKLTVGNAVFQALGAASMCWVETPKGVFDSTRAEEVGMALLEFLYKKKIEEAEARIAERLAWAERTYANGTLSNELLRGGPND